MMVLDNHLHLQKHGENVDAVRRFKKMGGTHINLTNTPDYTQKVDASYHRKIYDMTIEIAHAVRRAVGVGVIITLGPYPADLVNFVKNGGAVEDGKELMFRAVDLAVEYIENGKANAIGEIGRPHFPVSYDIWEASNEVIIYAMRAAKNLGVPVILHTESATEQTWRDLAAMADKVGISKNMVIKHYSPPVVGAENYGIFPSIIASRKNVREALKQGTRFLLETDFMDEPSRPNAVLPIESVPRRARWIVQEYGVETWEKIMDNARRIYGGALDES